MNSLKNRRVWKIILFKQGEEEGSGTEPSEFRKGNNIEGQQKKLKEVISRRGSTKVSIFISRKLRKVPWRMWQLGITLTFSIIWAVRKATLKRLLSE